MPENFTRETTTIKTPLSPNEVWSLFSSLDFWMDNLPPKITQLSVENKLKAGATGQVVFNGQTYTLNLIAWEKPHTLSLKVSQEHRSLFLLQVNLDRTPQGTKVTLYLFDYQAKWYRRFLPGLTVRRWFLKLTTNLKNSLTRTDNLPERTQTAGALRLPRGFYLWHRANSYTRSLRQVLKPFRLTPTQWFILKAISDLNQTDKQLTHEDVAKALDLHPVVVSDMVATLVRKNLVRKIKPPNNKRAFHLFPSPVGTQVLKASQPSVLEFDQTFFSQEKTV